MISEPFRVLGDLARLWRYLARLLRDPRVPATAKAKLLASGVYLWIDGDLVSDAIGIVPGLGYVDDLVLVLHAVTVLVRDAGPDVAQELWPGDAESFRRTIGAVVWLDRQLYGRIRACLCRFLTRIVGEAPAAPAFGDAR